MYLVKMYFVLIKILYKFSKKIIFKLLRFTWERFFSEKKYLLFFLLFFNFFTCIFNNLSIFNNLINLV